MIYKEKTLQILFTSYGWFPFTSRNHKFLDTNILHYLSLLSQCSDISRVGRSSPICLAETPLTCVHVAQQLLGGLGCGLACGVKVAKDVDVGGEVDHVLLTTTIWHTDEAAEVLGGTK